MGKRKMTPARRKYLSWFRGEKRRKLKLKAIAYKGGCCVKCGYNKCPTAMTFHHREPHEKEALISKISSWPKMQVELDKCDLLCHNCHIETHTDWQAASLAEQRSRVPAPIVRIKEIKEKRPVAARNWPSDDELRLMVEVKPLTKIAAELGVSDNAVRHRCLNRGIPLPHSRGYWAKRKCR